MLTGLFSFSSRIDFPTTLSLKGCIVLTVKLSWIFKTFSLRPTVLAWRHEAHCLWSRRVIKSSQPLKASDGGGYIFTLIDLAIIYIDFGSNQLPVSSKIPTVASLIKEISARILTNLLKKDLTYWANSFKGPF